MKVLTKSTRPEFVAENAWAAGMSTSDIRKALSAPKPHAFVGEWTLPTGAHKAAIRAYKDAVEAGIVPAAPVKAAPKAAKAAPKAASDKPTVYKAGGRWYGKVSGVTVNAATQADAMKAVAAILSA